MNGDSLPVSAFVDYADGTFQQGAAAYEKRGVSVTVPEWTAETCAQCNQCAYVCPHATIRPYTLSAEEAAAAPEGTKMVDHKMSKGKYKYALAVSPLDCMGCAVCVSVCPTKSLKMVGQESQLGEQKVFDYMVKEVTVKSDVAGTDNVIKSQYLKPLSGVLRLLRRLRRDELRPPRHPALRRPYVRLQRHGLLLHLGRSGRHFSVLHEQERQGRRLGELPL